MYKKFVGIVIFGLLIATAMSAVGNFNEKEKLVSTGFSDRSSNYIISQRNTKSNNFGGMFIQLPPPPEDSDSSSWTSDSRIEWGYQAYDDFWEVTGPICDIHWWGCSIYWNGLYWEPCDPPVDMTFNISFYKDDGSGMPGDIVCSYVDVLPSMTETGIYYWSWVGFYKQLYYFEYDLDPCCQILDGWVSIVCTGNKIDGHFLWMRSNYGNNQFWQADKFGSWIPHEDDLAFVLTDGESAIPVLECDGEIRQTEVPPGTNVTGDFVVRNNGDADSILQWRIDNTSIPNWGSNWTFTPSADFQTPDMGWLTVIVNFTAPDEENKEFTGKIKVVNAIYPREYCEIDVYIKTPRSKEIYKTFLMQIFERFPNIFPIIRQLLGL